MNLTPLDEELFAYIYHLKSLKFNNNELYMKALKKLEFYKLFDYDKAIQLLVRPNIKGFWHSFRLEQK